MMNSKARNYQATLLYEKIQKPPETNAIPPTSGNPSLLSYDENKTVSLQDNPQLDPPIAD